MIPIVNYNGDLIQKSSAIFGFDHLAIFNGEIIQENLRLWDGELMYAEKHYFHLMAMMRMARLEIPMTWTPSFFYDEIHKLVKEQTLQEAKISFNVSSHHAGTDFWITAKVLPKHLIDNKSYEIDQYRETHVSNGFFDRIRFLSPTKRILNTYAFENELQDLILLNEKKHIARAIEGNIFVIKDDVLYTPELTDGAIDSVFRDMTLLAAKRVPDFSDIRVEPIFPFALMKADEVFIVIDGEGFYPVTRFRKKTYESQILPSILAYFEERA